MQGNVLGSRASHRLPALLAVALASVMALVMLAAPALAMAAEQKATLSDFSVTFDVQGTPKKDTDFTATLTPVSDDAPMPEAGGEVATVTGADTATFGPITFTKPGVWDYTVTQTTQTDNAHWTLDTTTYYVQICAQWKDDDHFIVEAFVFSTPDHTGTKMASVTFTNTYTADGKWEVDPGEKWYKNGDLKAGDFSFDIYRQNGDEWVWVGETTNEAGVEQVVDGDTYSVGTWSFAGIDITEPGTFEYKVTERLPEGATADNGYKLDGITYDPTVYYYDVTVEAEDGVYKASVVECKDTAGKAVDKPTFTNVKEEPNAQPPKVNVPGGKSPKTGDTTNLAVVAIVLGVGVLATACGLHLRKKARR